MEKKIDVRERGSCTTRKSRVRECYVRERDREVMEMKRDRKESLIKRTNGTGEIESKDVKKERDNKLGRGKEKERNRKTDKSKK